MAGIKCERACDSPRDSLEGTCNSPTPHTVFHPITMPINKKKDDRPNFLVILADGEHLDPVRGLLSSF